MRLPLLFLLLLIFQGTRAQSPAKASRVLDSLQRVAARHAADTAGARAHAGLLLYYLKRDTAQARAHGFQAWQLAAALRDTVALARTEHGLGMLASSQGRMAAVSHFQEAARLWQALGETRQIGYNERAIGSAFSNMGQFPDAMRYLLQGLRHSQGAADSTGVAQSYAAIGQLQINMRDYPAAQASYEHALRRWQRLHAVPGIVDALNHLAIIQRDTWQYGPAAATVREGLRQARTDSALTLRLLITLGVLYQKQERWAESLPPLRRAERLIRQDPNASPHRKSDLFSLLGLSLVRNGQAVAAAPYMQEALVLARLGHAPQEEVDALEGLADVAAARHEYAAAFGYERRRGLLQDSLHSTAVARQTSELQVRYQAVERDARIQVQTAQLRTQQQLIRRRNTQLLAGTVVAALLAALAYLAYTRYRLRQRLVVEQERQQLTRQLTAAVLAAEENERRRIGSDLHDSIGQLLAAARLNLYALHQELDPAGPPVQQELLDNATAVIDESVREVRGISHNLMPNALLLRGLGAAVRDFLDKLPSHYGLRAEVEVFGLDARLDPTVESVLFRVLQELVQNIIKHAQATEITLQLVQSDTELTVVVEDNGTGFDPQALPAQAGIGIRNVQSRIAYLGGQVHFDSAPGRGTTVSLDVPLARALAD